MDARNDKRRNDVELFAKQILGPGEQLHRLRAEQFDNGIVDVGQSDACFLHPEMRRDSPKALFADKPDAVRYIVEKATLAFETLCEDNVAQVITAAEALRLEV